MMLDTLVALIEANPTTPFGLPVEAVSIPPQQSADLIAGGLVAVLGVNADVARLVASETREPIAWPFVICGFRGLADEDNACFVFHRFDPDAEHGPRVEVTAVLNELRLTRAVIAYTLATLFDDFGAGEIVMRLAPDDRRGRRALQRLGFEHVGREMRPGHPFGHLYSLRPQNVPLRWHRYAKRHWN